MPEPILNSFQIAKVMEKMTQIITSSGWTANLLRVPEDARKSRYGNAETEHEDTGITFPFEWNNKAKTEVKDRGEDAKIQVLPDLDIRTNDHFEFRGVTWKVLNVMPENFFGTVTHRVCEVAQLDPNND